MHDIGLTQAEVDAQRAKILKKGRIPSVAEVVVRKAIAKKAIAKAEEMKFASYPPPPLTIRALTIVPTLIGFIVLDVALVSLTIANSVAIGLAPTPFSKGIFVATEIILGGIDVFVAYLHLSYAHWVATGLGIHSWSDLTDWKVRP